MKCNWQQWNYHSFCWLNCRRWHTGFYCIYLFFSFICISLNKSEKKTLFQNIFINFKNSHFHMNLYCFKNVKYCSALLPVKFLVKSEKRVRVLLGVLCHLVALRGIRSVVCVCFCRPRRRRFCGFSWKCLRLKQTWSADCRRKKRSLRPPGMTSTSWLRQHDIKWSGKLPDMPSLEKCLW